MAQVIARSEIHRTVNGKKQIIQPGTVFVPQSPEEEAQLRKARAIRDPEKNEKVAVPLDRAQAMADADAARENDTKAPASKTAAKPKTTKAAKTAKKDPLKAENEAGGGSQSSQTAGSTGDADSGSGNGDDGDEGGDDGNLV